MKRRLSRMFLMIAGIITVAVILLSQSIGKPLEKETAATSETKKEQKSQSAGDQVSNAPADVVPSSAIQLDKTTPSLLKIVSPEKRAEVSFLPESRVVISFFKTFLRAAISPNAP